MEVLLLTSMYVFFFYMVFVIGLTRLVPTSVSETYYYLAGYNMKTLFTLFCWSVSIPLMIYWIDFREGDLDALPFIACGTLAFVGASPAIKDSRLERRVHRASAVVCAVTAYVWSFIYGDAGITALFVFLSAFFVLWRALNFKRIETHLFWLELLAFINIYVQMWQ